VTTGFTAGIAVVIATLQIKDFFGLTLAKPTDHWAEHVAALFRAAPTFRWPEVLIGAATLAILFAWPRLTKRVPGALVAVVAGAALAAALGAAGHPVATIGSRFAYFADGVLHQGIPPMPPSFVLPWRLPGPAGAPLHVDFELLRGLLGPAFAIAILGAIESLLCAVVADSMAGTRHDPDVELVAQGAGNLVGAFFGGFAATGAIARTATAVRSGARTPVASIVHAAFVLATVLALGRVLGLLPMASLAALLLYVAWNMADARHFVHVLKVAPKSDIVVLLVCFGLTVVFDMVMAVGTGIVLAALLFMGRMAELSTTRLLEGGSTLRHEGLPPDVLLYEIAGPLFFGAAEKAVSTLSRVPVTARAAILDISAVPVMDVTGLVALETAIGRLNRKGLFVVVAGVQSQPAKLFARSGLVDAPGRLALCATLADAVARVGR
jgi:SulP family sulfate permease